MKGKLKSLKSILAGILCFLSASTCVPADDFSELDTCEESPENIVSLMSFSREIGNEVVLVKEEIILKLFVTSSDRENNVYGAIYMQDHPEQPGRGLELKTDLRDAYLMFPKGAEVYLNLKGLYVRSQGGALQVGSVQDNFGSISLARIPERVTSKHLIRSCKPLVSIVPKHVQLDHLEPEWQFLCVRFDGMEVTPDDLCKTYAEIKETSERKLSSCDGGLLTLVNSGYSDFRDQILPPGLGNVSGVLKFKNSRPQLLISNTDDLVLQGERCTGYVFSCVPPEPNSSIARLKELSSDGSGSHDLRGEVIEAVIIADDSSENFNGEIYLRDSTGAMRVEFAKKDLFREGFTLGSKVILDIGELIVVRDHGEWILAYPSGSDWIPVPEEVLYRVIYQTRNPVTVVDPREVSLADLGESMIGEYVQLREMQFAGAGLMKGEFLSCIMTDCLGGLIQVSLPGTYNYDLQPGGEITISGILSYQDGYWLKPVSASDLAETGGGVQCPFDQGSDLVHITDLVQMSTASPVLLSENIMIEGIVISDAEKGNYIPDAMFVETAEGGIPLFFIGDHSIPRGARVRVNLLGGTLNEFDGMLKVEGLFPEQVMILETGVMPVGEEVSVDQLLGSGYKGKWVSLYPVALQKVEGVLTDGSPVGDCRNSVNVRILPGSELMGMYPGENSGRISGFFYEGVFIPGRPSDFSLDEEPLNCDSPAPENGIFISEIADPLNVTSSLNSRFIELYNSSEEDLDLSGWELRRYTNGNPDFTVSTVIALEGKNIPAKGVLVIAASSEGFEQVYGFPPDLQGGISSAADCNGDDNIVLTGPSGEVVDMFGRPGEDGTGTDHDFQDGRAHRLPGIQLGSRVFSPEQWEVFNGHGESGTVNRLLNAPEDFDPGIHK